MMKLNLKSVLTWICAIFGIVILVTSQAQSAPLNGYDSSMENLQRLYERGLISHGMTGKRADLPMLCKKMGVACEDELMGLWLRMMPGRHPIDI